MGMKPRTFRDRVESFMDRASSLIFPGSRTLAGWWRQLGPHQPLALGIGYGFLHRIEASVNVLFEQPIDPLTHLVLQALALEETDSVSLTNLQQRLRLPAAVVQRILAGMQADGLLTPSAADHWQTTEQGNQARERRSIPVRAQKRRVFPFLERLDPSGQRLDPPAFIPIAECAGVPWPADDFHRFEITALQHCIQQPIEWKQACGFPLDIETLADDAALEAWQHVVVDRPERVMLVLMLVNEEGAKEVQGFVVKVDGWTLFDRAPVLRLPAPANALWPQEPPMLVWQDAWRSWCKQRQLPANEVETCALSYQPPRLEVRAPGRLVQRLQAAKSDLFKGEAWLLVGDGYMRTAVQLTIPST
jgi:hypothetical protein